MKRRPRRRKPASDHDRSPSRGSGSAKRQPRFLYWVVALVFASIVSAVVWTSLRSRIPAEHYVSRPHGTVTFNKDIAPLVFDRCAPCHRPGQAAPFSLLTFPEVKKHAKQIAETTEKRLMPPWLPEPDCAEFSGARRLSAGQLGLIQQWVAEGAIEGNSADLPPAPQWAAGWQLGQPDLVLRLPQPYTLGPDGKDIYRNFVIPIPITNTHFVQAVELVPDNPKIVHHAFIKIDRTRESRRLDERDAEPGFGFMNTPVSAQMPEGHFLGWVPGKVPSKEPKGLAWTVEKDTDLVLQLHMRPTGKPETIQPSIGFYFTDQPPTNTPFKILLTSHTIDIPPGVKDYVIEDSFRLPVDVEALAVMPHGHYLCRDMQGLATLPDGTKKWLIRIKNWDFNWQGDYQYSQPVPLPKGTTLLMRYTYDNSTNNIRNPNSPPKRAAYGPQTTDEMGELWLQVLPRNRDDLKLLTRAFQSKMQKVFSEQYAHMLKVNPEDAEAHNGVGMIMLAAGKQAEAAEHFRRAVEIRPDFEDAHFYLGYIYQAQKKLLAAATEYEAVARINTNNYQAYGNLGLIQLEQGNPEQAVYHLENALRLNPDDTIARKNLEAALKAQTIHERKR